MTYRREGRLHREAQEHPSRARHRDAVCALFLENDSDKTARRSSQVGHNRRDLVRMQAVAEIADAIRVMRVDRASRRSTGSSSSGVFSERTPGSTRSSEPAFWWQRISARSACPMRIGCRESHSRTRNSDLSSYFFRTCFSLLRDRRGWLTQPNHRTGTPERRSQWIVQNALDLRRYAQHVLAGGAPLSSIVNSQGITLKRYLDEIRVPNQFELTSSPSDGT